MTSSAEVKAPQKRPAVPAWRRTGRVGGKTVISLDGNWFKLVHVGGLPQPSVRLLLALPVRGLEDAQISSALSQKFGPPVHFDPGPVLIANPSPFTTVRLSHLPSTDPKEIREIVALQAERYTPYAKEEILTGFKVIQRDSSGYSGVLLAISHRDVVHRAVSLIEKLDWPIDRVGGDVEGFVNWFALSRGKGAGAVLLADVDNEATTVVVLQEGRPLFHRSIACGLSQVTADLEQGTAPLIGELHRSIEAFEGEGHNAALAEVVLTGLAERIPGFQEQVQKGLSMQTSVLPTFAKCPVSRQVSAQLSQHPVSYTALVGMALGATELDLTPHSVKLRQAFEGRVKALMVIGGQLIALLLLLSFLAVEKTMKIQELHQSMAAEQAEAGGETDRLTRSLDQIHLVRDRMNKRGTVLEALAAMSQTLPPEIHLQSLTFTAGESVVVKGVSSELPKVFELVSALSKSPLFVAEGVVARRVSKRTDGARDVSDFEIVCPLASAAGGPA